MATFLFDELGLIIKEAKEFLQALIHAIILVSARKF